MTETSEAGRTLSAEQLAEIRALDEVLERLDTIRALASKSKSYSFDEPWAVFVRRMRMLTPQAYGTRIQNYLAGVLGWTVVGSKLDRGDVVDADGQYWEIKSTIITASNPGVNFVQIRPHQDIAGYHCFVIDRDYRLVHLRLTKADMAAELARFGSSAHGTTTAVVGNTTREFAIRFPWTPETGIAADWIARYGQATAQPA